MKHSEILITKGYLNGDSLTYKYANTGFYGDNLGFEFKGVRY